MNSPFFDFITKQLRSDSLCKFLSFKFGNRHFYPFTPLIL